MIVAEILFSIVVTLGAIFFMFLVFWNKWKNQETRQKLKLVTIAILIIFEIGLLIIDTINQESFVVRVVVICLLIATLALNAISFYLEKKSKKKENKEKENS